MGGYPGQQQCSGLLAHAKGFVRGAGLSPLGTLGVQDYPFRHSDVLDMASVCSQQQQWLLLTELVGQEGTLQMTQLSLCQPDAGTSKRNESLLPAFTAF